MQFEAKTRIETDEMKIDSQALKAIEQHSLENYPNECCGVLLGRFDSTDYVFMILPGDNIETEASDYRYSLGHKAHLKAVDMELAGEARILGYYHSHPNRTTKPSYRDELLAVESMIYIITSVQGEQVKSSAWMLQDEELVETPMELCNSAFFLSEDVLSSGFNNRD